MKTVIIFAKTFFGARWPVVPFDSKAEGGNGPKEDHPGITRLRRYGSNSTTTDRNLPDNPNGSTATVKWALHAIQDLAIAVVGWFSC